MAYVESFYLEPESQEPPIFIDNIEAQNIESLLAPETDVTINASPVSDYCGFESDEMPPIYRAQLRAAKKTKILETENADKSMYAYATLENQSKMNEMKNETKIVFDGPQFMECYIPGFSPPPQSDNDEVLKRTDNTRPKLLTIDATEHIFKIVGNNESSQYVPMEHEDPIQLNTPKRSEMEATSPISYTASDTSLCQTLSAHTASLGPEFGCLHSEKEVRSIAGKYKGLSAFRPLTASVASHYVLGELN